MRIAWLFLNPAVQAADDRARHDFADVRAGRREVKLHVNASLSEFVLLRTHRCEARHIRGKQEWVCFQLLTQHRRHAGLTGSPQLLDFADELMECLVVRIDGQCETGVALGIFMPAAHQGIRGKGGQLVQAVKHLCWRALDQPAAAKAEQRVARQQHRAVGEEVVDLAARVAGCVDHPGVGVAEPYGITLLDRFIQLR